ncbi:MAG: TIGR04282 family arsenosugar biosynthesis glycosyltransferase [Gammaproteobacteria bacterium]
MFAKAPDPGAVKSRLISYLGAQGAADLYLQMARHCIQQASSARLCPVELWCSPSTDHPFFQQCAQEFAVSLFDQCGGGLGDRMAYGLADGLQRAKSAVIIGTDCPAITVDDLGQCLHWLHHEIDVVLGPTEDAGYYLLGARKMVAELFSDIPWGGPQVLSMTRQRIESLGMQCRELATRWDVDRPEDVKRLKRSGLLEHRNRFENCPHR